MINRNAIVYEDDDIIVVNKPAGLLTVPTPRNERNTLTSQLNLLLQQQQPSIRVFPCHRLDRDTSGLIVYAKSRQTQQAVMEQFKRGVVKKKYIAFIRGRINQQRGIVNFSVEGKKSVTKYCVLQRRSHFSILEVESLTGRTNQVRIHFAKLGFPLLGDRKFAFGRDFAVKFRRAALHAWRIEFLHPRTRKKLYFHCELADDMSRLVGTQINQLIANKK